LYSHTTTSYRSRNIACGAVEGRKEKRLAEPLELHLKTVARALRDGRVIPFLGAGVNLAGRPAGNGWTLGNHEYLPDGRELASYLATEFNYPTDEAQELVRVSQYATVMRGQGPLYLQLRQVFDADYPPGPLHGLLARLPRLWREKGYPARYALVMTTNYDDLLERAFDKEGEPYDVVTYVAEGRERGRFVHRAPDGTSKPIKQPNRYPLDIAERTVILKLHGAVNRSDPDADSYVISEDHYIDYLSNASLANLVPAHLNAHMQRSHFLFLGYSMRDWNLRVILRRIWGEQILDFRSWSIQVHPDHLEQEFWPKRNVDIYDADLEEYVRLLELEIAEIPEAPG
jgi:hypothetical protein